MHEGQRLFEIDRFVANLIDDSTRLVQADVSSESSNSDRSPSSLFEELSAIESSLSTQFTDQTALGTNQNAFVRFHTGQSALSTQPLVTEQALSLPTKIFSPLGWYLINPSTHVSVSTDQTMDPSIYAYLKEHQTESIDSMSLAQFPAAVKEFTVDHTGIGHLSVRLTTANDAIFDSLDILKQHENITLYTTDQHEFVSAKIASVSQEPKGFDLQLTLTEFRLPQASSTDQNVKSINTTKQRASSELRYAPKDQSSEVQDTFIERPTPYLQKEDRQQLVDFIQRGMNHSQWPLREYVGRQGHRAWRALKLAVGISALDIDLTLHYHRDHDWLASDDDHLGSFSERPHSIRRTK
jgi:hypothetical protein